uniref:PUM-HD domain-containing protein n=1 Tax=Leersia perrieri TaxID=77586 RepID=A0A0D9XD44_9ORYZ
MAAPPPTGKGKEVVVVTSEAAEDDDDRRISEVENDEDKMFSELTQQMEVLRLLGLGNEPSRRREEEEDDVASTSSSEPAANLRHRVVAPAMMMPGGIWADTSAAAPSPCWTPRPRHGGGGDTRRDHNHGISGGGRADLAPAAALPPFAGQRTARRRGNHLVGGGEGEKIVAYLAANEEMVLHTLFHAPLNEAHLVADTIVDYAVDIMDNVHGQRLLTCVLNNCCFELHEAIVARITQHRDRSDGVVRMIKTCRSRKSCQLVRDAIVPWVMRSSKMQNLVLVDAMVENCIEIACHPNGLLFLQNCLECVALEEKYKIFTQVSINSLYLAKHRSGNYIVQDVLELGDMPHLEIIASCFKTHYVDLAQQKYSSRVVEKCLRVFGELEQGLIICELIVDLDNFRDLVTDEVANYVISTALLTCTEPIRDILANAILSLQNVNQRHPHCLKIFDILSKLGYTEQLLK